MPNRSLQKQPILSSGHKIAFEKCYFYLIVFVRDDVNHGRNTIEELPGKLKLREGFNLEPVNIKRLEPNQTH